MNGDGVLSDSDTSYLSCHISGNPSCTVLYADGDVNCDNNINTGDVMYIARHMMGVPGYETLYPTC